MILKQIPLFSPTPPSLEKIFHPHPYYQIWGSQSPPLLLYKGVGSNYERLLQIINFV